MADEAIVKIVLEEAPSVVQGGVASAQAAQAAAQAATQAASQIARAPSQGAIAAQPGQQAASPAGQPATSAFQPFQATVSGGGVIMGPTPNAAPAPAGPAPPSNPTQPPAPPKPTTVQPIDMGAMQALQQMVPGIAGVIGKFASAVGPAAVAILAVDLSARLVAAGFNALSADITTFGDVAASVAKDDLGGALTQAVSGVAGTLAQIPIVGQVWAAEMGVGVAAIKAFTVATNAFLDKAHSLAQYSPEIAIAEAKAEIRGIMADIHEGQDLGAQYAELVDINSKVQADMRDILMPIKEALLPFLINVLKSIDENAVALAGVSEGVLQTAKIIADLALYLMNPLNAAAGLQLAMDAAGFQNAIAAAMLRALNARARRDREDFTGADRFWQMIFDIRPGP